MLALQQCDALVAVLGTKALNYAAAVLLSVGRELLPVIRTVTIDHKRIDGESARMTLPHFSVSSAMSLLKSAGVPASTVPPISARPALIFGSESAALIYRLR